MIVLGTQNPAEKTLKITCQINLSMGQSGRQTAGALVSSDKSIYLAHSGRIGGGKVGVSKSAFLRWREAKGLKLIEVIDGSRRTPYILVGKVNNSRSLVSSIADFVYEVEQFKRDVDRERGSIDDQLEREAQNSDAEGIFQPGNIEETLRKSLRSIAVRQGQPAFRAKLLRAYKGRCAMSDCDCQHALEAAHIRRYGGELTNHVTNGLLLRSDLHTLFDLGKISIDSSSSSIIVSNQIKGTVYGALHGKKLNKPSHPTEFPNPERLDEHRRNSGL